MEHGGGAGGILTTIHTVAETGSTNADLIALAQSGVREGYWLRAERQVAGRGRQGRVWQSPAGNVHASTIVRLRPGDPPAPTLALVAGLALADTIAASVGGAVLKWPNDVLLGGAKLAGILLERAGDAVVVGFGINVAHHPDLPDRRTTSLAAHDAAIGPGALVERLATDLAGWIGRWRGEGLDAVRTAWLRAAHPLGTGLRAELPDHTIIEGRFAGLDASGALLLALVDGSTRVVHAGDVFAL